LDNVAEACRELKPDLVVFHALDEALVDAAPLRALARRYRVALGGAAAGHAPKGVLALDGDPVGEAERASALTR
jgi:hypothetical protein